MKLINSSSVLLAAVALSSMTDRANAQMPSIEDVIAMISGGQVEGTNQPEVEPQASSVHVVADTALPQEYVAPEIENFSSTGESDVEADGGVIYVLPADPMPVPSAAPSALSKPITCIDRSLEVCCLHLSFFLVIQFKFSLICIGRLPISLRRRNNIYSIICRNTPCLLPSVLLFLFMNANVCIFSNSFFLELSNFHTHKKINRLPEADPRASSASSGMRPSAVAIGCLVSSLLSWTVRTR